jgi:hypothetical protein
MNFPNVVLLSRFRNAGAATLEFGANLVRRDIVPQIRKLPLDLWAEARGRVIRKRYEALKTRIDAADISQRSACFDLIKSKAEMFRRSYAGASSADRKRLLQLASAAAHEWSDAGEWPRSLAIAIIVFNLETGHLPGRDASVVKAATDALIKEANSYPAA